MEWRVSFCALAVRAAVGLWGYSGRASPPMFGDFEAQRHWMEITTSLPLGDWYRGTAENDLLYWGLDYPPLTAYVSWAFGMLAKLLCPDLVLLHKSRGFEGEKGKNFMRCSVLFLDLLIYTPAVARCVVLVKRNKGRMNPIRVLNPKILPGASLELNLLSCLLIPSLILIDNGHFQYNSTCIGLALAASACVMKDRDLLGSLLFCLSLNFKQMSLYYSPVFFFALLRKCYDRGIRYGFLEGFVHLVTIGLTVIFTFAMLWWPFCLYASESETCFSSVLHVLSRQFPFNRGIFEDKVANIWYSLSVIFDFRTFLSIPVMAAYSLYLTLVLLSPICYDLLANPISVRRMILSLVNSALAFFLASFQVHEKSLLLALAPASLLLPLDLAVITWFQIMGCFTMYPLLLKDNLQIPYIACSSLFLTVVFMYSKSLDALDQRKISRSGSGLKIKSFESTMIFSIDTIRSFVAAVFFFKNFRYIFIFVSVIGMVILHIGYACIPPLKRFPDLYPALFALFGTINLVFIYLYFVIWQLRLDISVRKPIRVDPQTEKESSDTFEPSRNGESSEKEKTS